MKKYKEVEEMLYSYNTLKAEIRDIELDIETLENDYVGISSNGQGEIKAGSATYKIASRVENEVINKEQKMEYLKRLKRVKEIKLEKINNMLTTLTEEQRDLLELRYFKKYKMSTVAYKLDVSEETIKKNRLLILTTLNHFVNGISGN